MSAVTWGRCEHTATDSTGAVMQCTEAPHYVHGFPAGTVDGQPATRYARYCLRHSAAHLDGAGSVKVER